MGRSNEAILSDMFAEARLAHEHLHGAMLASYEDAADISHIASDVYSAHERMHSALRLDCELDTDLLDDWIGSGIVDDALAAIDDIIYLALPAPGQHKEHCESCRLAEQEISGAWTRDEIADALADRGWDDGEALGESIEEASNHIDDFIFLALPEPVGTHGLSVADCKHCRRET